MSINTINSKAFTVRRRRVSPPLDGGEGGTGDPGDNGARDVALGHDADHAVEARTTSSRHSGRSHSLMCCRRSPDGPAAESGSKDRSATWTREIERGCQRKRLGSLGGFSVWPRLPAGAAGDGHKSLWPLTRGRRPEVNRDHTRQHPTPLSRNDEAMMWPLTQRLVTPGHFDGRSSYESWAARGTCGHRRPSCPWVHGSTTQNSHPEAWPRTHACCVCMPKTHADSSSTDDASWNDPCPVVSFAIQMHGPRHGADCDPKRKDGSHSPTSDACEHSARHSEPSPSSGKAGKGPLGGQPLSRHTAVSLSPSKPLHGSPIFRSPSVVPRPSPHQNCEFTTRTSRQKAIPQHQGQQREAHSHQNITTSKITQKIRNARTENRSLASEKTRFLRADK